ncbi:BTAD domain-containing putative transcriptional regulator [Nonomuraea pusilla]|uniref:Transcriptional regulatory protein, C terminal n=1 Tax=Nonomuraea pusilla TaxID=46177 RepID=A0A1H7ZWG5_9ACTN|nr:BTAD domain-containing putative transcriptional regulator [Nonomuraea pusilla]SEM61839.1 Transcriptional regulatory protein, C terminal [Nonomuraea pusilla]
MLGIHILGPLHAVMDGTPVDLGSARQRSVLARLVAAGGQVVSTDRFIEDLWQGQPPPKALAALQVYVSNLRRALEPGRPPRAPATVLVSAPPGYRLRLPDDAVDAWRLPRLIDTAGAALKRREGAAAHALLNEALGLWSGPAYAGFSGPWAADEAARLAELQLIAVEYRAEAALLLGRHAEAVPELRRHANAHPLRENAVRLLALALYRTGSQAAALGVLRKARENLARELGVDPGPALRALEQDILRQSASLQAPEVTEPPQAPDAAAPPQAPEVAEPAPVRTAPPREPRILGRARELALLLEEAERAAGTTVWLGGEPGAGKSALAEAFAADLAARGWRVAFGRCPEIDGDAPPAWAWSEILRHLTTTEPSGTEPPVTEPPGAQCSVTEPSAAEPPAGLGRLAPLLRDGTPIPSQFQLARALADYLTGYVAGPGGGPGGGTGAAGGPLLVVLEDVHRADGETLHLLRHLPRAERLLVVATHRPAEATEELRATVAALAGSSRHLELGGLDEEAVAALLRRHAGHDVDDATVRTVLDRTLGNPLFVSEIARLLASEGPAAAGTLPPGVRDTIRRRITRLPATAQTVLRNAAVVGRDARVDVLVALHDGDEDTVLDGLEAGVVTGLLTEPGPGRVRFTHVLVRQALYEETPRIRRTRLHGRVLAALERLRPGDVAALARHALEAAAPSAVRYASAAAAQATGLHAHREAAALLRAALEHAADDETRLDLLCGLVSALGHAGDVAGALAVREEAVRTGLRTSRTAREEAARTGLRTSRTARALTSYDAPVTWTIQPDTRYDAPFVAAVEAELAAGHDDATRCRLLAALVFALEGHDDERVAAAGTEAVAVARRLGRPDLLCLALNARYFTVLAPHRRDELDAIGAELLELGTAHRLVGYLTLGHLCRLMAALGRGDLAAAQRHADLGVEMSTSGQLGQALVVLTLFGALRRLVEGDFDGAEDTYTRLLDEMGEHGGVNAQGMAALARFTVRLARGDAHRSLAELAGVHGRLGNNGTSELYAAALAATGDLEGARRVWRPDAVLPLDYYWLLWQTMRGGTAVLLGDRAVAGRTYENLLPWDGEMGGMHCGSVTLGPVALVLGDLARLLGRDPSAHYAQAVRVAELVGSPHWARTARARLAAAGRSGASTGRRR